MTDNAAPSGVDAQLNADVNTVESMIESAVPKATEAIQEDLPAETVEQSPAEEEKEVWPKKAENALAKEKGKNARLKFERDQARQQLEQTIAKYNQPQKASNKQGVPMNLPNGEPNPDAYENYDDLTQARIDYVAEKKLTERDTKQQETQKSQQIQEYYDGLYKQAQEKSDDFVSKVSDAQGLFEEYGSVIEACPDNIYALFLESGDAPLAAYNLIKQGKLQDVIKMSPAKAAIEIGRALAQAPTKPQTKAPTPLPASRGSVPLAKQLKDMTPEELVKLVS